MQGIYDLMSYIEDVYGQNGYFSKAFPGYESRKGQMQLSAIIDRAIAEQKHVLAEGPCGTGKGIAYLVPSIYRAKSMGLRVVVATANIALQEQLISKDLPTLAKVLPQKFTYALMKGRNNYLCVDAWENANARSALKNPKFDRAQVSAIEAWAATTDTGDVSELSFVPASDLWNEISVTADTCKGSDCRMAHRCHANNARERAANCDVIVTNYHLLFAHIKVRMSRGEDLVLPPHQVLVLDEAHEAAAIARKFFGWRVTDLGVQTIAKVLGDEGGELHVAAKKFFAAVAKHSKSKEYNKRLRGTTGINYSDVLKALGQAATECKLRADDDSMLAEKRFQWRQRMTEARNAAERIAEAMTLSNENSVYWIESDERVTSLNSSPIFVGELLREQMFDRTQTVIMTSATMTTSNNFEFMRRECGVPDEALELVAESPFDFRKQAICITPPMPDPRQDTFVGKLADVVEETIKRSKGRTLALFTSYRNMRAVANEVQSKVPYTIRMQGELPRTELTRMFRDDVSSCLFGVDSFWTGVDVQGESLSTVIVDKFPFDSPDDPVLDAICEKDRNAFFNHSIPRAIMKFRQGVGRLIRSQKDRGVIVFCDPRVHSTGYGKLFLRSIPGMALYTKDLGEIDKFLK